MEWCGSYEVTPEEFGMSRAPLKDIVGGDAVENASDHSWDSKRPEIAASQRRSAEFSGRAGGGGQEPITCVEAMPIATRSIDSGAAATKLDGWYW
jgi:anthranilate phosphoribosyltransferase